MRRLLLILFLLLLTKGYSQKQNANWYFGMGAGLNFNTTPTSAVLNGQTNQLSRTASISDENGSLLFYTDGKSVWNKNHQYMQNGNQTLESSANPDAYESVLILPIPGSDKYYIFTKKAVTAGAVISFTYYFSVVNMTANGNLGNVEVLNTRLLYLAHVGSASDNETTKYHNMTSAVHDDGTSYWFIIKPNDQFYAFQINSTVLGMDPPYVTSSATCSSQGFASKSSCQSSTESSLKTSPDNQQLASVVNFGPCLAGANAILYDFNNSTGQVQSCSRSNVDTPSYISLDFSPNGDYLYVLKEEFVVDDQVLVFDTSAFTNSISSISIPNSANLLIPNGNSLQRGVDSTLYLIKEYSANKISTIINPDDVNSVQLLNDQITFTNKSFSQFPKFIPNDNSCISDLTITQNVNSGETDNQQAGVTLTATNIIQSGGTANYDAGTRVYLKPGFHAKSGSVFRAFIDGCTTNSNRSVVTQGVQIFEEVIEEKFFEDKENLEIKIYPNPTTNYITIESEETVISYRIFNRYGKQMSKKNVGALKWQIEMSNLSNGLYFLELVTQRGEIVRKKIVKD